MLRRRRAGRVGSGRALATRGEVVFGPGLPMGFSAYSKQDIDRDGTIYTWGLKKPPFIGIAVGKIAANGDVLKVAAIFHFPN